MLTAFKHRLDPFYPYFSPFVYRFYPPFSDPTLFVFAGYAPEADLVPSESRLYLPGNGLYPPGERVYPAGDDVYASEARLYMI